MDVALRSVRRHDPDAPLLVLFHDDGEDTAEAIKVGRALWLGAPMVALRGPHAQNEGWRHLEDVGSVADLSFEASGVDALAERVRDATRSESALIERVAIGRGGGADAVLALLCRHPRLFAAAALWGPRRTWSRDSLEEIERGNGIEVLIVAAPDRLVSAAAAKLMLGAAGYNVELTLAIKEEELKVCRHWLRKELRGEDDDAE